ncbi:hypothetical protein GIB67_020858 [Kingdonia uniflora]|uniref:Uncharacterized protein n=1 Tax=Kingdonia uniflora TaxID=39325 RepID=A0A7J7M7C2_9MAGN|nr:hypothetical protein GIB67_020858 [Kingdonia uniflora]
MLMTSVCGVVLSNDVWVHLYCGGLMGFIWIQSSWLGHDSEHYQIMSSHGYNSLEFDPNLQHMPFFAVSLSLFSSLRSYFYERKMNFDVITRFQHSVPNRIQEIIGILVLWICFPLVVSFLPNWGERVMFVLASFAITGVQQVQFCLNHFPSSVYVGPPVGNNWFENQTRGMLDITWPSWMDWFHGSLL